jgi:peptidoglycan hydrolase-like protein with peptidoglycan-binding domain
MLQLGNLGLNVLELQRLLNTKGGYSLHEDGIYGNKTEVAIKDFQAKYQLPVTGSCDELTLSTLKEITSTKFDVESAAAMLMCDVASIKAVSAIESSGGGFLSTGKVKILYERHWMYKRLKAHQIDPTAYTAKYPNIVSVKPGGYKGGSEEYERLAIAISIHRASALESASWGMYQIMGFHWERLGYTSIEEFVTKMQSGEAAHLEAFVKFISKDANLWKALKSKNWANFARIYNGPSYAQNSYDTKLATAYQKYA